MERRLAAPKSSWTPDMQQFEDRIIDNVIEERLSTPEALRTITEKQSLDSITNRIIQERLAMTPSKQSDENRQNLHKITNLILDESKEKNRCFSTIRFQSKSKNEIVKKMLSYLSPTKHFQVWGSLLRRRKQICSKRFLSCWWVVMSKNRSVSC